MFHFIYRLVLTFNATSWIIVIHGIKEEWAVWCLPAWATSIAMLLIPVLVSLLSIPLTLLLSRDELKSCEDVEEANNSFLPTYLGYFFIGLGVEKTSHLLLVYAIVFLFTHLTQSQYFNPLFLLFGYRYYHVTTRQKTKVLLISREQIRCPEGLRLPNLRRINNTTYIAWRRKDESADS